MVLKRFAFLILSVTIWLPNVTKAQSYQELVDSLNGVLKRTDIHDTARAMTYINLGSMLYQENLDTLVPVTQKGVDVAEKALQTATDQAEINSYRRTIAIATSNMGFIIEMGGDLQGALRNYRKCLAVQKDLDDKKGSSITYYNFGYTFQTLGQIDSSIFYFKKSITLKREVKDSLGLPSVLEGLSLLILSTEDTLSAIKYMREAREISLRKNLAKGICSANDMLGKFKLLANELDSAEYFYNQSYEVAKKYGSPNPIAKALRGLAQLEYKRQNYQASVDTALSSLKYAEKTEIPNVIISSKSALAAAYFEAGNVKEATRYGEEAYDLANKINDIIELRRSAKMLMPIQKASGNFEFALQLYERYTGIDDSLQNEKNTKEIIRTQYAYEYEKQALADSIRNAEATKLKDAELATERAENRKQRVIIYFVIAIVAVILFFVYMVVKSLRLLRVEKAKVDDAYDELGEKNKEIMDSINYAKRIQSAILPPNKLVNSYLEQSFILYKPKDIVAGDFYWLEPLPAEKSVLFAAADCTGHGVPGAMVSVICNNGLNRAVREHGLREPGQILDKARDIVISEFEKSEDEVKDGMDVALCWLSGNHLKYAGAHNPLWIVRKGSDTIEEIKADKQPIGKFDAPVPYTTHSIELKQGDTFYIFSDGYADQFGGDKGKKFKAKNFKDLLLSIQHESMEKQRLLIDDAFENWKGEIEQLDDVCVIGVRV